MINSTTMKSLTLVIAGFFCTVAATYWIVVQPTTHAQWTINIENNDRGQFAYTISSGWVKPTITLPSPFGDSRSQLLVFCNPRWDDVQYTAESPYNLELRLFITKPAVADSSVLINNSRYAPQIETKIQFDNEEPISLIFDISYYYGRPFTLDSEQWKMIADEFIEAKTAFLEWQLVSGEKISFRYPIDADAISALPCTN